MRLLIIFLATGAFTGYAPVAPGTFGSVLGLMLCKWVFAPVWRRSPAAFAAMFAVAFVPACAVAGRAETLFKEHDSSRIVLDEVFGITATMFLNPAGWAWMVGGFALFRAFDIIKPWPASAFDRIRNGAGVMLDDLAAGIYANLVLQFIRLIV
ncbi:MAG TPA: phosphatidylglycerophosphatase A [Candidatus Binataceae bacterium]|nr:phosphatidylglycerophosphatase A [Candidatus Binataceae bacterium]